MERANNPSNLSRHLQRSRHKQIPRQQVQSIRVFRPIRHPRPQAIRKAHKTRRVSNLITNKTSKRKTKARIKYLHRDSKSANKTCRNGRIFIEPER